MKILEFYFIFKICTLIWSTTECFIINPYSWFSRTSNTVQPLQRFQGPPITFAVPKGSASDLNKMLKENPDYFKKLLAQSNNPNSPISIVPQSRTSKNQIHNGIPNVSNLSRVSNSLPNYNPMQGLPDETYINGQKFVKTTRANILFNKGRNFLNNGLSLLTPQLSQYPVLNIVPNNKYSILTNNDEKEEIKNKNPGKTTDKEDGHNSEPSEEDGDDDDDDDDDENDDDDDENDDGDENDDDDDEDNEYEENKKSNGKGNKRANINKNRKNKIDEDDNNKKVKGNDEKSGEGSFSTEEDGYNGNDDKHDVNDDGDSESDDEDF